MKNHEKTELGKFQEEYQNFFLGSALGEALEGQDPTVRKEISNLIYDTEGLNELEKGFNVILENLDRVPGGSLVKNVLWHYVRDWRYAFHWRRNTATLEPQARSRQ